MRSLRKKKLNEWHHSVAYQSADALSNWNGPLPSKLGLCLESEDLALITAYHITKSKLIQAIEILEAK